MTDEPEPDPLKLLAEMVAAMAGVATMTRSYYIALISEGFTEDQAIHLVTQMQASILTMGKPS